MTTPLWTPSKAISSQSHMTKFIHFVNQKYQLQLQNYDELHAWSVAKIADFWQALWDFSEIKASKKAETIYQSAEKMQATKWFVGAELNFAENLLARDDDHLAIIFRSENGYQQELTYVELQQKVATLANYLKDLGIKPGDRVAAMLPNIPETVIAMLASTSLGAIWSSCSPDFGLNGLLDRFQQIQPKVLFAVDGHFYHGKTFKHLEKLIELQQQLPSVEKIILIPYVEKNPDVTNLKNGILFTELDPAVSTRGMTTIQLPFDHPLYILYSSGTTGKPKCMVHGAGRTLIQHKKELLLHTDLHADDKIFFFTTCGWMMWNWLVSSLSVGATIVLYEGSPLFPNANKLFDLIDDIGITIFGVGAKLLETAEKEKIIPKKTHSLKTLKTILTTGSPLLPDSFQYVYRDIKKDVRLSSISGGSDIISCFALGNPLLPVYSGELQCLGLGMDVKIFDELGQSIKNGKGELVCASPFPSMPIYFWNDTNGEKYQRAYFDKFPNIWAHGDYALLTERNSLIIYGRSDATLNPAGVRIGTAEIYNQVEHFAEIIDCIAVGQNWQSSERILLFIKLRENAALTDELISQIKTVIRNNLSPHHVPAEIIAVPDIPRTISGKIVELTIKKIVNHEPVKNTEALANPESLAYFQQLFNKQ